jgi:hypothetical protein
VVKKVSADCQTWSDFVRIFWNEDGDGPCMSAIQSKSEWFVAALVFVNLMGTLFTILPSFLAILVVATGWIWPTCISQFSDHVSSFFGETQAIG